MRTGLLSIVIAAALAGPAWAQVPAPPPAPAPVQPASRPTRAVFGGGTSNTGQGLTANFSIGSGADQILFPKNLPSHKYGSGSGSISYSVQTGRVSGGLSAGAFGQFLSQSPQKMAGSYSANASLSFTLSKKSQLSVAESFSYSPYSVLQFFPQQQPDNALWVDPIANSDIDPSLALSVAEYYSTSTSVNFSHQVTRRGSANVGYHRSQSNRDSEARLPAHQSVNAGMGYGIAKGLNFRAGYGVGLRDRATGQQRLGTIDIGLDFSRALSISRKAHLSFNTGFAGLSDGTQEQYRFIGDVQLSYELGRSWSTSVSAHRNAEFIDVIEQPVMQDSVTFGVSGLLTRRVQFNSSVGLSGGQAGLAAESPKFHTVYTNAGVQLALSRHFALGTNYSFYRYRFDSGMTLPLGVATGRDRQSIRVTFNAWLPLITRSRSTNASR